LTRDWTRPAASQWTLDTGQPAMQWQWNHAADGSPETFARETTHGVAINAALLAIHALTNTARVTNTRQAGTARASAQGASGDGIRPGSSNSARSISGAESWAASPWRSEPCSDGSGAPRRRRTHLGG
jgi:hypothetical protein